MSCTVHNRALYANIFFLQGWLYGIKDGRYGLFPSDFVERMSPQAIRREMRMISKVTRSGGGGGGGDREGGEKGRRYNGNGGGSAG